MRPHSGTVLYTEGPALNQPYWGHHSKNQDTAKDAASGSLPYHCTVSDCFFIC